MLFISVDMCHFVWYCDVDDFVGVRSNKLLVDCDLIFAESSLSRASSPYKGQGDWLAWYPVEGLLTLLDLGHRLVV